MSAKDEARRLYHNIAARLHNDICYGQLSWTIQRDAEHTLDCNEMTERIAAAIEQAEARGREERDERNDRIQAFLSDKIVSESAAARDAGLEEAETAIAKAIYRLFGPSCEGRIAEGLIGSIRAMKRGGRE